jgi:hypothetical protein
MRVAGGFGKNAWQFRIALGQPLVRGEDHVVQILRDQLPHDVAAPVPPRRAMPLPVRVVHHHRALFGKGQ